MTVVGVLAGHNIADQLSGMGVPIGRPVVVLFGGARGIDDDYGRRLYALVRDGVVATAAALDAVIVDGGTDSGVMALAGKARAELAATVPLVGVAPAAKVRAEGVPEATGHTRLEKYHSHQILVGGREWGDESPELVRVAQQIAGDKPVAVVLIDGGPVALMEAIEAAGAGWPIIAVSGSGRSADLVADYVRGWYTPELAIDRDRVFITGVHAGAAPLAQQLRSLLTAA